MIVSHATDFIDHQQFKDPWSAGFSHNYGRLYSHGCSIQAALTTICFSIKEKMTNGETICFPSFFTMGLLHSMLQLKNLAKIVVSRGFPTIVTHRAILVTWGLTATTLKRFTSHVCNPGDLAMGPVLPMRPIDVSNPLFTKNLSEGSVAPEKLGHTAHH